MITSKDIFINDNLLCLTIADANTSLRGYEFPKERKSAKLFKAGQFIDIPWLGIQSFNNHRCLCFDAKIFASQIPLPASELSNSLRAKSFKLLKELATALKLIEQSTKDFLAWSFYSLPLSSFYFFPDDSILLLPCEAVDLIEAFMPDQDRFLDREIWYVHEQANDFGKANFLFQLVYYALIGSGPYQALEVRNTGFKPIPASVYFKDNNGKLTSNCEQFLKELDKVFKLTKKEMYQVSNPYEYFLQQLAAAMALATPNDYVKTNSLVYKDYLQKLEKKSNFSLFLRKKGSLLAVILTASLLVIAIIWYYVARAIAPPETRGYSKEEIVRYYYNALNELDITGLEDSLAHGCESPDSSEVITLTVTAKTRMAYENIDAVISPQKWIEEGMPDLVQGGMVYGATNIEVEEIGDLEALASLDFYRAYEAGEAGEQTSAHIAKYRKVVKFSFVQKKDWLEIAAIEELQSTLLEVYEIPYKDSSTSLLTSSDF